MKPIAKILTAALAAAAISSCAGSDKPADTAATLIPVELTNADDAIFGNVLSMNRVGDYLILGDSKIDSLFHLVDLNGPTYIRQFGRKGNGPGEFSALALFSPIPNSANTFGIFDAGSKQLTIVTIAPDGSIAYAPGPEIDGEVWQLIPLANGSYVTSPGYAEYYELLNVYAPDGSFVGRTAKRPMPESATNHKPTIATAAWQFNLAPSPDGTRISAMGSGEAASFLQLDGDSITTIASFYNPDAELDHNFSSDFYMGIGGKVPMGFVSQSASPTTVYYIVADRALVDDPEGVSYVTGSTVKAYTWQGSPAGRITLDKRIRHLAAPQTQGDNTFYAITEDGCDPTLVSFTL